MKHLPNHIDNAACLGQSQASSFEDEYRTLLCALPLQERLNQIKLPISAIQSHNQENTRQSKNMGILGKKCATLRHSVIPYRKRAGLETPVLANM